MLTNPSGSEINVSGGTLNSQGYNLWENACAAQWKSGAGVLPCPSSTDLDPNGLIIKANSTILEDGMHGPAPSLLLVPNNKYNGYIQGTYPAFTVQPGDRFFSGIGCEYGARCYVTFRLDYMTSSGSTKTFWTRREQNEGQNHTVDVNLTPLAGQSIRFILTVSATGSATGDRVRWIAPYIMRAEAPPLQPSITPEPGLIIRGRVTKDGVGLPNVQIYRSYAAYSGQQIATTDANGYYRSSFWSIPGDETVNIWAVQEGIEFNPPVYSWRHYHGREDRTLDFTAANTVTVTPIPDTWTVYTNLPYGFKFNYPNNSEIVTGSNANRARINLPFQTGTNLTEKYMNIIVVENANPCRSPLAIAANVMTSQNVVINGINFLKEEAGEGATGHFYKWEAYSTMRGNVCVNLEFVLHSLNTGAYSTPPPMYNYPVERLVFDDILLHFAWLEGTITPGTNQLPDLKLGPMALTLQDPTCLKPSGNVMGVKVPVTNQGQAVATSFTVQVNDAQQTINGLGVDETILLFFPGSWYQVTAIVDPNFAIVESDESNNSYSGWLPIPTAPLPCPSTLTFTPSPTTTPTETPVQLMGPYAVILVAPGDMLNIRSGAGASNPIIGSFARETHDIMRTGLSQTADGAEWVEVLLTNGLDKGWVNSNYLSEYETQESFCNDARIPALIGQLKQAAASSNGALLGSLVSPKHGWNLNYWASSPTVNYTSTTAQTVFTDQQSLNWGSGGGSGANDIGTFAEIVQPQLVDVLNSGYQLKCDEIVYGASYTNVLQYQYANTNIHFYSVIKPPTNVMDWKVWLVRIEYVNGQPYLFGTVHYVWEP
ncbi:MAG: hypothetical protein QM730_02195 [Anaerolineales bacterium]